MRLDIYKRFPGIKALRVVIGEASTINLPKNTRGVSLLMGKPLFVASHPEHRDCTKDRGQSYNKYMALKNQIYFKWDYRSKEK